MFEFAPTPLPSLTWLSLVDGLKVLSALLSPQLIYLCSLVSLDPVNSCVSYDYCRVYYLDLTVEKPSSGLITGNYEWNETCVSVCNTLK